MRVITLGTSAGRPTLHRSASCTALEYEGEVFLFDCGEGTQTQLARSPLKWGKLKAILIGHMHGDHINGLPGLLGTLSLTDRQAPLQLFGPRGIKKYLYFLQSLKNLWINFPLEIKEVVEPGIIFQSSQYQIETEPLNHIIECWGYVFREKPKPGIFNNRKAEELGIPQGPIRMELLKGRSVTLSSGALIRPEEIVGPPRKGRSMAYCLDTQPCEGDLRLAYQVDMLVHEATFDESLRAEMKKWGHSTAIQAAEVAKQARVGKLVMTHISPRYPHADDLLSEARTTFSSLEFARDFSEFFMEPY